MTYLWLKALHLAAVITWAGGMLMLSVLLGWMARQSLPHDPGQRRLMMAVYRWDRWVTNPALGVVWLLGLTLAWQGGWFSAHWLWAKLVLVTVLSALHGNQSATLRRLNADAARPVPAYMRPTAGLTVAAVSAIVVLVVLKP
jgi:uncharacterized membrane protein